MKKYFVFAAAVLFAMTACTKNDVEEVNQEISFQTSYYSNQTKADDTHGHKEFTGTFKVRAYYTGDKAYTAADLASDAVVYMDDVEISKQSSVWKATTGTYYWPKSGKMSFIGYTGWTASASWTSTKASVLSFTETISTSSDPMVSDLATDLSANPSATHFVAGVPILFHHAAAQVGFKGQAETSTGSGTGLKYEVKIDNVTIKSMNTKGTYTVDATAAAISGAWSGQTTAADRTIISSSQTVTSSAADLGTVGTVLPQSVASLKAQVTYTIVVKNNSTDAQMSSKTFSNVEIALATSTITSWQPNKKYIYTIKISPVSGEITFDPAVVDWDTTVTDTIAIN